MNSQRLLLLAINVLGGAAVLGSYAVGIRSHANAGTALWGGVPEALRPVYTASMLSATVGYLAFTAYVLFRVEPEAARVGPFGYGALLALYLAILVPSALWMPLTFGYLAAPSRLGWIAVRLDLFAVALGALAMIAALARVEPAEPRKAHRAARVGAIAFAVQCAVLDPLIWPAFFPDLHGG